MLVRASNHPVYKTKLYRDFSSCSVNVEPLYSGTSVNGHLIRAVICYNSVSTVGPERPPNIRNT